MRTTAPLLLAALTGCSLWSPAIPPGRPVSEAHSGRLDLRVLDVDPPLRPQKRIPVLSTPEVFAAWVPSHARGDLLIGEHWLFFKLREAEWFTERLRAPEPVADGDAPAGFGRPLERFDGSRVTVPHR